MKNTIKNGVIHLLVISKGGGEYLGICKEFGFVEEAKSEKEVVKRLVNSSILLLDTVRKNPRLAPSLNVRPPFKYLMLFYIVPIYGALASLSSRFNGSMRLISKKLDTNSRPAYA